MSDTVNTDRVNTGGRIKKFFNSRAGELTVLLTLSALALLFTVLFYSSKFTEHPMFKLGRDELSFWTANDFYTETRRIYYLNTYLCTAFAVGLFILLIAWIALIFKKKRKIFFFAELYNVGLSTACLIVGATTNVMRGGAIALCVVSMICSVIALGYMIARRHSMPSQKQADEDGDTDADPAGNSDLTPKQRGYKRALLICECVALAVLSLVLFVPVYSEGAEGASYVLIHSIGANTYPIYISIGFIAMIVALFGEILFFISTVSDYFGSKTFVVRSRHFVLSTTVFTLIFFLLGYSLSFYYNVSGVEGAAPRDGGTISYVPFLFSVVNMVVYAVFCGKLPVSAGGPSRAHKPYKLEPMFAVLAITAITFVALMVNIIEVHIEVPLADFKRDISFTGYELLSMSKDLDSGFQMLAFFEFAFLVMSGILFVLTLMGLVGKDRSYYKLVKISAIANLLFVMMIGLFGIYFKIGQKINVESIESIFKYYGITLPEIYEYEVSSQTIYMLIASVVIVVYMIVRKMFGLGVVDHTELAQDLVAAGAAAGASAGVGTGAAGAQTADALGEPVKKGDFDACPAFTEIDGYQDKFKAALEKRRQNLFANLTLPNLIRFLVDYARESRLHLSYTPEDMATFVAGLGASRLAILQGMSGTGKTSLPKIFTEALMSNCEIVEVESSWRDKNELLGYYNEFSKCYTPKKFTQCLYRARLNSEVITFIVLDEMNLSRIEYYFSDFLSLMENEEDRRSIKLLNVQLSRIENGKKVNYDGLKDGHTIRIPSNVWFIGTANRDESTFEISDKVYDRAQTMNFDKRAAKINSFSQPLDQRYVPYDMLLKLFDEAKASYQFDAESNSLIRGVEKLLAPYNISFGNRILRQMEAFVKIYCACFGDQAAVESDAVEKILLSKVVRKLENKVIENKDKLIVGFDKLGLKQCSAFVHKLNED